MDKSEWIIKKREIKERFDELRKIPTKSGEIYHFHNRDGYLIWDAVWSFIISTVEEIVREYEKRRGE